MSLRTISITMSRSLLTKVPPFGEGEPLFGFRPADAVTPSFGHYVRVFASSVGVTGVEDAAGMVVGQLPDGRWAAVAREIRGYRVVFEKKPGEHAPAPPSSRTPLVVLNPPPRPELMKELERRLQPPAIDRRWLETKIDEGRRLLDEIDIALRRGGSSTSHDGESPRAEA
jgi:hypothetical protein